MKKLTLLAVAFALTTAATAQQLLQTQALPFDVKQLKVERAKKAPVINADELVQLPESAIVEEGWTITGDYINSNTPYENGNTFYVAFDGDDVYFYGLSFLCGDAWIKGTINGTTATFANGQYVGTYSNNSIFCCGSDGNVLTDITFAYDATNNVFELTNFYLENTSATAINYYFYSSNIVVAKALPVPTEFEVNDIQATQATVNWQGETDLYNLRYRTAMVGDYVLYDFEDGLPEGWTTLDNDGDGNDWVSFEPTMMSSSYAAHSGDLVMMSRSWLSSGVLTPDNWLITSKLELKKNLSFWVFDDGLYHENLGVYVSTTGTNPEDFVQIGADFATSAPWTECTFDLSAYEGQEGYIAIRHYNCTDQDFFYLDDFCLMGDDVTPAGEWVYAENVTSPYTLTDLTAETTYEVQVQSTEVSTALRGLNDRNSSWTESVVFTTSELTGIETVKSEIAGDNNYYNLMGQKVSGNLPAGIYIHNGKKVVIK